MGMEDEDGNDVEDDDEGDVEDEGEEVDDFLVGGGRGTDLSQISSMQSCRCFSIVWIGRYFPAVTISFAANLCMLSLKSLVERKMVLGRVFGGDWFLCTDSCLCSLVCL